MSISVIIPTFNRAATVCRAIASVLAQTSPVFEIIVVDDGSTDGTADLVREQFARPEVRYVFQQNAGAGAARNLGLAEARGEWIAFLDSDDEWLPQKVEHFRQDSQSVMEADFFYSATTTGMGDGSVRFDPEVVARKSEARFILSSFGVKTSTVFVRAALVREYGLRFGTGRTCEDYEFFWKAASVTRAVVYSPHLDVVIGKSVDSLMAAHKGWKLLRDNFQAIDNVLAWMTGQEIEDGLRDSLLHLRFWHARNAMVKAILEGQSKEFFHYVLRSYAFYGPLKAGRLACSVMRVVLSQHKR